MLVDQEILLAPVAPLGTHESGLAMDATFMEAGTAEMDGAFILGELALVSRGLASTDRGSEVEDMADTVDTAGIQRRTTLIIPTMIRP
jgi:hypothetical protein